MHLTKNLKYLISKSGKTQEKLAKDIGVTRGQIASYLKGTIPPVPILQKIVNYFNIAIDDIVYKDLKNMAIYNAPEAKQNAHVVNEELGQYLAEDKERIIKALEGHVKALEGQLLDRERIITEKERYIQALLMSLENSGRE